MAVHQREIVEVNFQLPNKQFKPHPVIVISNDQVFWEENIFYAVMMSTKPIHDEFTMEITPAMVTGKFNVQKSFAKCQLIQAYEESEIISRFGSFKNDAFEKLKRKIFETVF